MLEQLHPQVVQEEVLMGSLDQNLEVAMVVNLMVVQEILPKVAAPAALDGMVVVEEHIIFVVKQKLVLVEEDQVMEYQHIH